MVNLKLSRQLLKSVYLKKLEYENNNLESLTMSEFIEDCLIDYLKLSIVDINNEKVPVSIDMYYENSIYTDIETNENTDTDDCEISFTNYVYVYMNPFKKLENNIILDISGEKFIFDYEPFYVGKGKGDRMFLHIKDKSGSNQSKIDQIDEIINDGGTPIIRIIKNGLTNFESCRLENIIITKLNSLTNISGGKSNMDNYQIGDKKLTIEYNKNKYILSLIKKGIKNKDISKIVGISERTLYRIKKNIKNIEQYQ